MKRLFSLALALFFVLSLMTAAAPLFASSATGGSAVNYRAVFTATPFFIGTAEGSLTITAEDEASVPDAYVLAWGNQNGPLTDYALFPEIPATGVQTVYIMPESVVVPNTADRILVYPVKEGEMGDAYATAYLPIEFFTYDYGEPIFEFGVASDIHINENNFENYNDHFQALLADLKATVPNASALYINGDIADWGKEIEYQMYRQFIDEAALGFPVYANYGNHDSREHLNDASGGAPDPDAPSLFKQYANSFEMDTVWFTVETEEANFVMFASSAAYRLHEYLYLTEENLSWLSSTLERVTANGKKTFLMFHQPLMDTVSHSFADEVASFDPLQRGVGYVRKVEGGAEVAADEDLFSILLNYPDIVVFTSHTHFTLQDEHAMYPRDSFPYMLNTAATAYISRGDGQRYNEAQALYVAVYEDKVLVRGRDVLNGKWLPTAQFALDFGMAFAGPMGPVPTPPADNNPPVGDPPAAGGCFGSMTATLPVCLASLGLSVLLKKKRHEP